MALTLLTFLLLAACHVSDAGVESLCAEVVVSQDTRAEMEMQDLKKKGKQQS